MTVYYYFWFYFWFFLRVWKILGSASGLNFPSPWTTFLTYLTFFYSQFLPLSDIFWLLNDTFLELFIHFMTFFDIIVHSVSLGMKKKFTRPNWSVCWTLSIFWPLNYIFWLLYDTFLELFIHFMTSFDIIVDSVSLRMKKKFTRRSWSTCGRLSTRRRPPSGSRSQSSSFSPPTSRRKSASWRLSGKTKLCHPGK